MYNFKQEVKLNKNNFSVINPINKNCIKRKKMNGKYIYEKFYVMDFLDIKENSYVISSFGRVFSLLNNIEMKTWKSNKLGYERITLQTNHGKQIFAVHCLVALAFVPKTIFDKKMERMFVHHKNWDNDYNYYWNLEWRSYSEIRILSELENNKNINEETLVKITCRLLERQMSIVKIFELLQGKISKDKISKIKNKIIYTEISCEYNF